MLVWPEDIHPLPVCVQVQVFSATTNQVKKCISRFQQCSYSACFRHDGKLLAAGSEEGVVKVSVC